MTDRHAYIPANFASAQGGMCCPALSSVAFVGPALTFPGLAPRKAAAALTDLKMELA